jgi:hypothetical protein
VGLEVSYGVDVEGSCGEPIHSVAAQKGPVGLYCAVTG